MKFKLCNRCVFAIFSCQNNDGKKKGGWCSCCLFTYLFAVFLLILAWMYMCGAAFNDRDDLNWKAFQVVNHWINWFMVALIISLVLVIYAFLLLIFAVLLVLLKEPLVMHCMHKVLITLALLISVSGIVGLCKGWSEELKTVSMFLKVTSPILHIIGSVVVCLCSLFVFQQFFMAKSKVSKVFIMLTYLIIVAAVFLFPCYLEFLEISSPCLQENIPRKPALIGHRGLSMMAPENTMMSFQKSVNCGVVAFETDVLISFDGVPFLMHDDKSLKRTTDVESKLKEQKDKESSCFTWKDLQTLNAGTWFVERDPFYTVSSLSEADKTEARNQSIPKLTELLDLANQHNISVIFDIKNMCACHPYYTNYTAQIVETINNSGIQEELVWWLPSNYRSMVKKKAPGFKQVYGTEREMKNDGGNRLNMKYSELDSEEIMNYTQKNVSVNLYVVNEIWLFSMVWCMGATSVTTNACHLFQDMEKPYIFHMAPKWYRIIWISVDCVLLLLILGFFFLQRHLNHKSKGQDCNQNGYRLSSLDEEDSVL
ncbi:glycerophosphoinositol inositolphosphodiesterase GDPD2 [Polypterus senegalus]